MLKTGLSRSGKINAVWLNSEPCDLCTVMANTVSTAVKPANNKAQRHLGPIIARECHAPAQQDGHHCQAYRLAHTKQYQCRHSLSLSHSRCASRNLHELFHQSAPLISSLLHNNWATRSFKPSTPNSPLRNALSKRKSYRRLVDLTGPLLPNLIMQRPLASRVVIELKPVGNGCSQRLYLLAPMRQLRPVIGARRLRDCPAARIYS